MSQVQKLKIFLASPSDVTTERRHVGKVIGELNRTVASDKGVYFEVTSSANAFPSYGKDGQAVLNEQIGKMHEYELFIGIMWNRIGTPTPRAKSGTVEEFTRAVRALVRRKKPNVWFYFRQSPAYLTTKEELKQREEVLDFRAKFRDNGLFRDYKTPAEFRDQLREHLTLWLNQRKEGVPKSRSASTKRITTKSRAKTKSPSSVTSNHKKSASATPSRKVSTSKSSATRSTGVVKTPKNWVMLDGNFFQAESSKTQPDRSIILQISPKDMEQAAELKALHPREFHNWKQISFADSHEAGIMQVSSVTTESVAGKSIFSITLNPNQRSQSSGFGEVSFNNRTVDEIAELRARLILLGESLPEELGRFFPVNYNASYNRPVTIEKGIFPELWAKLQTQPKLFLPRAWLWAAYYLKICQIVEDVLGLELGPVRNKVMAVRFRGKRKQIYSNQKASIINVEGSCPLNE